jgi:hypothetical protein
VENFAWKHSYLNIHKAMMIDVLHQLLKGITIYLITWVKTLTSDILPAAKGNDKAGLLKNPLGPYNWMSASGVYLLSLVLNALATSVR